MYVINEIDILYNQVEKTWVLRSETEDSIQSQQKHIEAMQNIIFDTSSYVCLTVQPVFLLLKKNLFCLNCLLYFGFKMQNRVV